MSNLVKITVRVEEETIEIQINVRGMGASNKRIRMKSIVSWSSILEDK